jgi:hypothetical protein
MGTVMVLESSGNGVDGYGYGFREERQWCYRVAVEVSKNKLVRD